MKHAYGEVVSRLLHSFEVINTRSIGNAVEASHMHTVSPNHSAATNCCCFSTCDLKSANDFARSIPLGNRFRPGGELFNVIHTDQF